jgi:4a-hydroxytetrahydrobiopterin dehydratase
MLPIFIYIYRSDNVDQVCLNDAETTTAMKTIPNWQLNKNSTTGDSITRSFVFDDFRNCFLFMSQGAQLAEKNQHHPNWSNLYNQLDVLMTTDDKLCLSTFDIEFAQGLDYLFESFNKGKR